jgi:hypothetical protein
MTTRKLVDGKKLRKELTVGAHSGRAHSKLGPSAASRWMVCAASVAMSEGQPNNSTVFALEGTAAHEFNEFVISSGHDPRDWLGGLVDLEAKGDELKFLRSGDNIEVDRERYFEIDEEMVEGCELTIETIEKYYSRVDGDELMLETRLDMSWIHPKLFGTGDILIYKRKTKTLIVLDYKYGSGHVVEVKKNPQVRTYAVGAAKMFEAQGVETITSVIIQPRAFHKDGTVRVETIDLFELFEFESELAIAAKRTDDPNATAVAGDHCKFCPAAWGCEALRDLVRDGLGVKKLKKGEEVTEKHMPKLSAITPAQLGRIVREAKIYEGFIRRALAHAHSEGMDGRMPEGTKMVEKRAYRKFTIGKDEIICQLDLEGFDEETYMHDPKMLTLAQLETAVGKKKFSAMFGKPDDENKLWKKQSSGYVLCDIDDDRPAAKISTGDAFGAVEEDDD